ncbi:unnamed protein product [Choristocarpus tenellus]
MGLKGDQGRNGVVLTRFGVEKKRGEDSMGGFEVGGLEVVLAIMECFPELLPDAPLMAFREGERWRVITRGQATCVLRRIVKELKLRPEEYALNSGMIGGVTRLATMGVSETVIQREGRRKWSAFMAYVRAN